MRLGLIARADNSGLGMQTWEFYRHMNPDKTLVMDISELNGNKVFLDRYPGAQVVKGILRAPDIDEFLQDLDVVFVAEAPYNYYLYQRARELGVKTAVQYNYEFFDWFVNPTYPMPDMLIAPSMWHYQNIELFCNANSVKHIYLHCPVDRKVITPRTIHHARTFLHTAGRSASHDRNGTKTVIAASKLLKSEAQIIIHFQGEQGLAHQTTMTTADYLSYAETYGDLSKLTILTEEFENYADAYAMGDVLILPRRYGGNCLPMNEALASGMPTIMPDIDPNNKYLPQSWLTSAEKIDEFEPRTKIDIYETHPHILARKIDSLYNQGEHAIMSMSAHASNLAEQISWDNMEWRYRDALESLCS